MGASNRSATWRLHACPVLPSMASNNLRPADQQPRLVDRDDVPVEDTHDRLALCGRLSALQT